MPLTADSVIKKTIALIAVGMSVYHLTIAFIGAPQQLFFRSTHLLFALTLVFLLYPTFKKKTYPEEHLVPGAGAALGQIRDDAGGFIGKTDTGHVSWVDWLFIVASAVTIAYVWINHEHLLTRFVFVDDPTGTELILGTVFTVIVLEATRRVIGWALPITALIFLGYALFIAHTRPEQIIEIMYITTEGIFGPTLGVSAAYVIMFVLFGAFMERTGIGQLFMDFALSLTGHTAGGPGKVAVVSSSLFGTVSGSAVANVLVDGPITIPLMKRTGFRPHFAAGVEAVASTGGQIMPSVMGAAAFVMAEFLGVPYFQVTLWALIPAILYYVACFAAVHFEARRAGIVGVPRTEIPRLGAVMRVRGHLFIPVLIILAGMYSGFSAPLCALAGTAATVPVALMRKSTRAGITWYTIWDALQDGARNTLAVACACACAGIVIGMVTLTGEGLKFTQLILTLARETLVLALVLTAMAGIVLGMGMPTTPAYIVMVSLLIPALIKLGVAEPAAHMFAFYFAILSAITPPVALAVYAASGLAKADLWKSGWAAVRIGAAGFIVPFMFVYNPELLMLGSWDAILWSSLTAALGILALAAGLHGYLLRAATLWECGVLIAGAMLLVFADWRFDLAGFALLGLVAAVQLPGRLAQRRAHAAAQLGE
jgi:TRAP transporter 4TM/12TM fusion protein